MSAATEARQIVELTKGFSRCLARIARAYEEHESGRITTARFLEVVRQETRRAAA